MLIKNGLALSLLSLCVCTYASSLDRFMSSEKQKNIKKGLVYVSLAGGLAFVAKTTYDALYANPELDLKRTAEKLESSVDRRVAAKVPSENYLIRKVAAAVKADLAIEKASQELQKPDQPISPSVTSQLAALRADIAKLQNQGNQASVPQPDSVPSVKEAVKAIEQRADSSGDKKDGGTAS